jgi:hypothetical protein
MHTPQFNPAVPLPRKTLNDVLATGAGRAESGRLYSAFVCGCLMAFAILFAFPTWWMAATPFICVACFGGWGLAAQRTHALDRAQRSARRVRTALRLVRAVAAATGSLAALAGFFGTIALLMQRR